MLIIKAMFAVFSLIGNYFRLKKAAKLIRKTAESIKRKRQKLRLKKELRDAKGYPKLRKLPKLQKFKRV